MSRPELKDVRKLTRLTALWYVTEVLAKLITYDIRIKLKQNKRQKSQARNNECNPWS